MCPARTSGGPVGSDAAGCDGRDWVWFEGVRVAMHGALGLACIVGDRELPLPVVILHPDCTLRGERRHGSPRRAAVVGQESRALRHLKRRSAHPLSLPPKLTEPISDPGPHLQISLAVSQRDSPEPHIGARSGRVA